MPRLRNAAETAVFLVRFCPDDSRDPGAIQRGLLEEQIFEAGLPKRLVPWLAEWMIREAGERLAR